MSKILLPGLITLFIAYFGVNTASGVNCIADTLIRDQFAGTVWYRTYQKHGSDICYAIRIDQFVEGGFFMLGAIIPRHNEENLKIVFTSYFMRKSLNGMYTFKKTVQNFGDYTPLIYQDIVGYFSTPISFLTDSRTYLIIQHCHPINDRGERPLWVFTRSPEPGDAVYENIVKAVSYDVGKLQKSKTCPDMKAGRFKVKKTCDNYIVEVVV